jgi:hypothetical protein
MGEVKARVETVTPAKAKKMLLTNHANRRLTPGRVEQFVGAMQRGEWTLNGEPLQFNGDGTLLNGQHRLEALVQADMPQDFVIVRGVESDAQATMDQGQKRSLTDILQMRGVKFSTTIALSARATLAYERIQIPISMRVRPAPTIAELLDCLDRHPDIPGYVYAGGSTEPILTLSTGWKTALAHLFSRSCWRRRPRGVSSCRRGTGRGGDAIRRLCGSRSPGSPFRMTALCGAGSAPCPSPLWRARSASAPCIRTRGGTLRAWRRAVRGRGS